MTKKPYIIAIEDDEWYSDFMKEEFAEHANFRAFDSANEFEYEADENVEAIKRADLILVDWDLHDGKPGGCDLGRFIRQDLKYKGNLVLCTLHADTVRGDKKVTDHFDSVMHKRDLKWQSVVDLFE